jgi:hypothetical protein
MKRSRVAIGIALVLAAGLGAFAARCTSRACPSRARVVRALNALGALAQDGRPLVTYFLTAPTTRDISSIVL